MCIKNKIDKAVSGMGIKEVELN